jgi:long-subunit acyl-CoA synthetase (AMP-forming)
MGQLDPRTPLPPVDVVNTIATQVCLDERHRIFFASESGELCSWTLADLDRYAVNLAHRLHTLGVRPGARVGVLSPNRIEWVLVDLAVMKLGGVTAAVEPGRFGPEHVVDKYGLTLLFAEVESSRGRIHEIGQAALWARDGDVPPGPLPAFGGYDPADIFQIKQTSGSTGVPKGIETTVVSTNSSMVAVQDMFAHGDGDNILVFLPLWFLQQRFWIYSALVFKHDVALSNFDGAIEMAQAVSPTVLMGVPRFYDDLKARILASGAERDGATRQEAIQAQLGGRVRYLWTGSAPATLATLEFFNDGGVPLYQGYGQNETCIVAKNHPGASRVGSAGKVLPDKTVRFDRDGVLIVANRHPVNTRYTWCSPGDNEKIWLATGEVKTYDLGHLDGDGFLYLHGRVDDVISPSMGPNVLVTTVEEKLCELDGIADCVLYGNAKRFICAIVCLSAPEVDLDELGRRVVAMNGSLREEQRIHAIVVAPHRFSVDNGLLNSQFKPRRKDIHQRYAQELELIYGKHNDDEFPPVPPVIVMGQEGRE